MCHHSQILLRPIFLPFSTVSVAAIEPSANVKIAPDHYGLVICVDNILCYNRRLVYRTARAPWSFAFAYWPRSTSVGPKCYQRRYVVRFSYIDITQPASSTKGLVYRIKVWCALWRANVTAILQNSGIRRLLAVGRLFIFCAK